MRLKKTCSIGWFRRQTLDGKRGLLSLYVHMVQDLREKRGQLSQVIRRQRITGSNKFNKVS